VTKIVDSNGAVLGVGSRVRHVQRGCGVVSRIPAFKHPWLCIEREGAHSFWVKPTGPHEFNTYRADDLTLIPDAKEKN
jgi:hypothetical protein